MAIKQLIDKATGDNKWVASRSELEKLIRDCNRNRVLSDEDLGKYVKWFISGGFDGTDPLETTLTKFYRFVNVDAE